MAAESSEQYRMASLSHIFAARRRYTWLFANERNDTQENRSQIMQYDRDAYFDDYIIAYRDTTSELANVRDSGLSVRAISRTPYFARIGLDAIVNGARQLSHYVQSVRDANQCLCLHEVLLDWRARRIVFDIDGGNEETFARIFRAITEMGARIAPHLDEWDVYDSSSRGAPKFSRHIVSRTCAARNAAQACAYARALIAHVDADARKFIDGALLQPKRSQNLRTCFSTKWDEGPSIARTKVPLAHLCGPDWTFERSLVQYTLGLDMLPDIAREARASRDTLHTSIASPSISEEQESAILQWCNANGFALGNFIGPGLIDMPRIRPSYCNICSRAHDNRGGYVVARKHLITAHCRRADDESRDGATIIWERTDYRADFVDSRGDWFIDHQQDVPLRLISRAEISRFVKFVQRTLAFIRFGNEPYYVMRMRDSEGALRFVTTRNIEKRGPKRAVMPESHSHHAAREVKISFGCAVERFALDAITYSGADFVPFLRDSPSLDPSFLNLWTGFARNTDIAEPNLALVQPLLDHLLHVWCRDNTALYEYVISWFAYLVQQPSNPRRTALIVRGQPGCGKTSIVEYIGREIIGRKYYLQCDIERIMARFNDDLHSRLLILIDETYQSEVSQTTLESKLKNLITAERINIESKGMPIENVRNAAHFIFCSNADVPIRIDLSDRRYCALECCSIPVAYLTTRDPSRTFLFARAIVSAFVANCTLS